MDDPCEHFLNGNKLKQIETLRSYAGRVRDRTRTFEHLLPPNICLMCSEFWAEQTFGLGKPRCEGTSEKERMDLLKSARSASIKFRTLEVRVMEVCVGSDTF